MFKLYIYPSIPLVETFKFDYECNFLDLELVSNVNYAIFRASRSKQEDCHEIWPDNDFANCPQEFGRTKKWYL